MIFFYLQTALHISAYIGCPKNIQTLLNHNANVMLQDSNGLTALDIALNTENTTCIKLLKDASGNLINTF
jgi:ankyrin repeat protein